MIERLAQGSDPVHEPADSRSSVKGFKLAGEHIARDFEIVADEPLELLGGNRAPNPQELLMAAVNACMTAGYVGGTALNGVTLERREIETTGEFYLRGFLGLDALPEFRPVGYIGKPRCSLREGLALLGTADGQRPNRATGRKADRQNRRRACGEGESPERAAGRRSQRPGRPDAGSCEAASDCRG